MAQPSSQVIHLTFLTLLISLFMIGAECYHPQAQVSRMSRGPSFEVGGDLYYVVVMELARYLHQTHDIPLSDAESCSKDVKQMKTEWTSSLAGRLKDRAEGIKDPNKDAEELIQDPRFMRLIGDDKAPKFDLYEDDDRSIINL